MVLQLICMKEQERKTTECMQNLKRSNKNLPKEKNLPSELEVCSYRTTGQAENLKRE